MIAALYTQLNNKDQRFHIPDIKKLFESNDLAIPNVSGFLDTMEIQKLVSKVSNSTKKGYKLMDTGEQHIRKLLLNEAYEEKN